MKRGAKRKYFTAAAAREARLEQMRARRRFINGQQWLEGTVPPVHAAKPIHQVFLSTTLPILGSYGFGVVVRRSL